MGRAYNIVINEMQRGIIEAALGAYAKPGEPEFNDTPEDEAKYLLKAFATLPNEEDSCPGACHGFAS